MPDIFRADVVGSLLRPASLAGARADLDRGAITRDRLIAAQDDAVRANLALQQECGLPVVTDGEVRRRTYTAPLSEGLEGLEEVEGRYKTWRDSSGHVERLRQPLAVTGRLKLRESIAVEEYRFTRTATDLPVKVTVPSPLSLISRWGPDVSAAAYPDPFDLFADSAEILRGVVGELVQLGCRYIQFDAPELTAVVDPGERQNLAELGISDTELLRVGCDLMNDLANVGRDDVRFAMHLCRGNNKGMFLKSGGYERMVATLYERTDNISTFMLEFDDERSGGFQALQGIPEGKVLVLGLVSTKVRDLEDAGDVAARIEDASRYVPLDQLALSTQCGFSSTVDGAPLDKDQQHAKLSLVAGVAADVWGRTVS